ncbi:NAD-dependent epimerase/dehydratase family protein [Patescibacteria group bacterium AH-259-L05]|nr:NAD-dependent epimerase/dehydratase family protein [Patescibacteria group bacterium AH-259-L05]
MKILVTGGAGFIGSHLVDSLIQNRHKVYIIDDLSTGLKKNINPKAKFFKIDIRDKKVNEIFISEKPDIVFHCAAQINLRASLESPVFDADVNILGSLNVIENAQKYKVKKIIFSSTGGAIYGETKKIPTLESYTAQPTSPYGLSKLTVEKYLKIYYNLDKDIIPFKFQGSDKVALSATKSGSYKQFGLDYVVLRYANVYGPRQNVLAEAGVIAIFILNILNNKPCTINGSGRQTRDYVYVEDVVRANLLALGGNKIGIYNVGTGKQTSVNQIFKKLTQFTNSKISKKYEPPIKGELQRSALDWEKIKRELGWKPKIDLNTGLKLTIDWFKKR